MKNYLSIKKKITDQLEALIIDKINEAKSAIKATRESRSSDTKSSAGDKYETGRAMMQMEIEKNETYLQNSQFQQQEINRINNEKICEKVEFGSIVITNFEKYFIAIAYGKLIVDDSSYYIISLESPIGMALRNKKAGETIAFRGRELTILEIH